MCLICKVTDRVRHTHTIPWCWPVILSTVTRADVETAMCQAQHMRLTGTVCIDIDILIKMRGLHSIKLKLKLPDQIRSDHTRSDMLHSTLEADTAVDYCSAVLCSALLCSAVQSSAVHCCAVKWHALQCALTNCCQDSMLRYSSSLFTGGVER